MTTPYRPLAGVRVLDLGILVPPGLTSSKLAAFGADVVKIEQPPAGDRIRAIPKFGPDGNSPAHMTQNWGKRSIALDLRQPADLDIARQLAAQADVIVENQLAGFWESLGLDFAALRTAKPALVVCSITGFGQTGAWNHLPAHGLNVDALGDALPIDWIDGQPQLGWAFVSWGNELGATHAAMATCAALLEAKTNGHGAWIDISCWDALIEAHRREIAMTTVTGQPHSAHDYPKMGPFYNTYLSSDGIPVLLGALEPKFWNRFCERIERADLIPHHHGQQIEFAWDDDGTLREELAAVFAQATAAEWLERFVAWDVPGAPVLDVPAIIETDHFKTRAIVEGQPGSWPNVTNPVRWHHTGERAGAHATPPPELDADRADILRDWLA